MALKVDTTGSEERLISFETLAVAISGTDADDLIEGSADDDSLFGRGGNDNMSGLAGDDQLGGGNGNDTIVGGSGSDTIFGGQGDDSLFAADRLSATTDGAGVMNIIWAGAGADHVHGDDTNDILGGGLGADWIQGFGGDDIIYGGKDAVGSGLGELISGGTGNDTIYAGNGNDTIDAGAGADLVFGGGDADSIYGGLGADEIWGGAGNDLLSGGTPTGADGSADLFGFGAGSGFDVVVDFEVGLDTLDVSATSLTALTAGVNAFESQGTLTIIIDASNTITLFGVGIADIPDIDIIF